MDTELNMQGISWEPVMLKHIDLWKQLSMIGKEVVERRGNIYGFGSNGKFVKLGKSSYKEQEPTVNGEIIHQIFGLAMETSAKYIAICQALKEMQVGEDIKEFDSKITKNANAITKERKESKKFDPLDRFITKIGIPVFTFENGKEKKGSCGSVTIEVGIIENWDGNKKEFILKNKSEILRRAMERISESPTLEKHNVKMSSLKPSKMTWNARCNMIEFTFKIV